MVQRPQLTGWVKQGQLITLLMLGWLCRRLALPLGVGLVMMTMHLPILKWILYNAQYMARLTSAIYNANPKVFSKREISLI